MAKKNFRGGLDNILSVAGLEKKDKKTEEKIEKKVVELSDDEKHWLQIKNERLNDELYLWRTGKINVEIFNESLKKYGLKYDSVSNVIR